jgi:hypothetical protein
MLEVVVEVLNQQVDQEQTILEEVLVVLEVEVMV